jgi:hypothetical protein
VGARRTPERQLRERARGVKHTCNPMRLRLAQLRLLYHGHVSCLKHRITCRYNFAGLKIGRKHKAHRQQLSESKPWRESEKGRKGKGKKGKGGRSKMGNEESHMVDANTPPLTLRERSLEALAEYVTDGKARQIVVMVRWHAYTEVDLHSPRPDRRGHKHISRHTRLPLARDGPLRQPREAEAPVRRSRLRHRLLPRQPRAFLHTRPGAVPGKLPADHYTLVHISAAQEGVTSEALHAEHRLPGARGWRTG